MGKPDFRRLNARIAYPWPVDAEMPQDVTGLGIDETIYGTDENIGPSGKMEKDDEV